ncbi:unnamed protein product [Schistosoma mattheei]|uniref:Uncharacterized protein n=1 Tax=Schistosoma mattheei TaxID=31246 RepID=A0AA85ARP6_9TREM|nr:unnamed protein product [Schistosoma mattheei]
MYIRLRHVCPLKLLSSVCHNEDRFWESLRLVPLFNSSLSLRILKKFLRYATTLAYHCSDVRSPDYC